jgi:hypothetical protein
LTGEIGVGGVAFRVEPSAAAGTLPPVSCELGELGDDESRLQATARPKMMTRLVTVTLDLDIPIAPEFRFVLVTMREKRRVASELESQTKAGLKPSDVEIFDRMEIH